MVIDFVTGGGAVETDHERAEQEPDGECRRKDKRKTDGRFRAQRFLSG
jgi:hypothetical protein